MTDYLYSLRNIGYGPLLIKTERRKGRWIVAVVREDTGRRYAVESHRRKTDAEAAGDRMAASLRSAYITSVGCRAPQPSPTPRFTRRVVLGNAPADPTQRKAILKSVFPSRRWDTVHVAPGDQPRKTVVVLFRGVFRADLLRGTGVRVRKIEKAQ